MADDIRQTVERVAGPDGRLLTAADLPASDTKHWIPRYKAEVVAAVRGGLMDLEEACDRYMLTVEEFLSWQEAIDRHGVGGLEARWLKERRRASRRTIEEAGELVLGDAARMDCVITNISSGGARLKVSTRGPLPATFELRCTRTGRSSRVSVVWQRGQSVGVRFDTALPVPLFEESRLGPWLVGESP